MTGGCPAPNKRRLDGHDGPDTTARTEAPRPAARECTHARLRAQRGQSWPLRRWPPPITCNCFRIHGLLTSNRVRFPRCTPLSEREPAGPRKPSVDGPGLIASVTTPEPVVTPKPIRSRPTDAVAAAAAPATPPVGRPTVLPTLCFRCALAIYRTASRAPGSARGAGAATSQPISVRRPGPERGRADQRGGTVRGRAQRQPDPICGIHEVGGWPQTKKRGERTPYQLSPQRFVKSRMEQTGRTPASERPSQRDLSGTSTPLSAADVAAGLPLCGCRMSMPPRK